MPSEPRLTLVVALASEARALVERYRLKLETERPFRVYASEELRLIVSGMGCELSACAVGFAAGSRAARADDVWLNFGIAGHRDLPCGSLVLGGRVRRDGSDRSWYPGLAFSSTLTVSDVSSHNAPVEDYAGQTCHEMEAAGFMQAGNQIANGDLLHVCKLVSDNAASGLGNITRDSIDALIRSRLDELDELIASLRAAARAAARPDPERYTKLFSRWHVTHAHAQQLTRALDRLLVLDADMSAAQEQLSACSSAAQALSVLDEQISQRLPGFQP